MNDSRRFLQYDYEVTGKELDTLVETAWKQPGVIGARKTRVRVGDENTDKAELGWEQAVSRWSFRSAQRRS